MFDAMRRHSSARCLYQRRYRLQPSADRFGLRVSLQDELERQFVRIERISKTGEGTHQHAELVQQSAKPERRSPHCDWQLVRGVFTHINSLLNRVHDHDPRHSRAQTDWPVDVASSAEHQHAARRRRADRVTRSDRQSSPGPAPPPGRSGDGRTGRRPERSRRCGPAARVAGPHGHATSGF